ncbi:MAG: FAD-dependent oxidoreductase [Nitrospira sp.]|uniref:glycerol-3-phosphate dehydrogenase/oxidase n=1 Tax=Thauera sp. 2A1 TaxID=2570191 RepID=UPI001291AAB4|nr:FAD-dependent oxidoreductase [Thauera sp. 2A1]KAI5914826.1 FAD-dependent oxidoreductase [Thauera sp. 2A1]MBS0173656.1 FAD-dependent oxidoreductase [Nitrospira sp.]
MRVAVVGAGIVGACTAWALVRKGANVSLFERKRPMAETSRASSKLLHGGLRYLERGHVRLVGKSLQARAAWLRQAPHLCDPLQLLLPVYENAGRARWTIGLGIRLYDLLARGSGFPKGRWFTANEVGALQPALVRTGLQGAYAFYDAKMDDEALGNWVVEQFSAAGGEVICGTAVSHIDDLDDFDRIVNATGPWALELRRTQPGPSAYALDWVRGSHIVLDRLCPAAMLLQVPGEKRIFFVLPRNGQTLIGTTEMRQATPDNPGPTEDEIRYLLDAYNHYLTLPARRSDVADAFAGVRPLIRSADNPSDATREWAFERVGKVLHIYGGKWTTAQLQGEEAAKRTLQ